MKKWSLANFELYILVCIILTHHRVRTYPCILYNYSVSIQGVPKRRSLGYSGDKWDQYTFFFFFPLFHFFLREVRTPFAPWHHVNTTWNRDKMILGRITCCFTLSWANKWDKRLSSVFIQIQYQLQISQFVSITSNQYNVF